ncbi:MAG: hypothetical protein COW84_12220 [Gammaproteobacteria bacterium CG22_combo_CG10-13_8_21_14_all_40_8]|nr:MAG: hypothetical protein COW84_12220 [Gammaproteobacteria bacterium CG22_combo_CG10-13_8_21_14_all_40_8]
MAWLRNAKRGKPGQKVRWFGRDTDLFQPEWSANAHHPYCFESFVMENNSFDGAMILLIWMLW